MKIKSKKYVSVIIILMFLLFVFQIVTIKDTFGGYLLNFSYDKENTPVTYQMLLESTNILLENINEKNANIALFTGNTNNAYYAGGMGLLMLRYELLPYNFPTYSGYSKSIDNNKDLDTILGNFEIDYVLLLEKNIELFNIKSSKDYSLYKVIDRKSNTLELVSDIDINLYEIYEYYNNKTNLEQFYKTINTIKIMIEDYYDFTAIEEMRKLALTAALNKNNILTKEYGNYYLQHVDLIDKDLTIALGNIYLSEKEYEQALIYFKNCINNKLCSDRKYALEKIKELETTIENNLQETNQKLQMKGAE